RMFRLALSKDGKQHSIRDEMEYTINYLKLQNIRFDDRFRLDIRLPEDMMTCSVIPLVFQPIVENSMDHGFRGYNHFMNIVIEGEWIDDEGILIRIADDGIGMRQEKLMEIRALLEEAESEKYKLIESDELKGKGIGLKNIAERIKLHYGDRYYLKVYSVQENGTTIEILIPNVLAIH
ncbi:MAG: putative sensor with domain, partial [Paenibacillus sp.]|nr:putative sensor with domain [Paenibacillus sp.]